MKTKENGTNYSKKTYPWSLTLQTRIQHHQDNPKQEKKYTISTSPTISLMVMFYKQPQDHSPEYSVKISMALNLLTLPHWNQCVTPWGNATSILLVYLKPTFILPTPSQQNNPTSSQKIPVKKKIDHIWKKYFMTVQIQ